MQHSHLSHKHSLLQIQSAHLLTHLTIFASSHSFIQNTNHRLLEPPTWSTFRFSQCLPLAHLLLVCLKVREAETQARDRRTQTNSHKINNSNSIVSASGRSALLVLVSAVTRVAHRALTSVCLRGSVRWRFLLICGSNQHEQLSDWIHTFGILFRCPTGCLVEENGQSRKKERRRLTRKVKRYEFRSLLTKGFSTCGELFNQLRKIVHKAQWENIEWFIGFGTNFLELISSQGQVVWSLHASAAWRLPSRRDKTVTLLLLLLVLLLFWLYF